MKNLLKPVFAAGLILTASAAPIAIAPAAAQTVAQGVGVISLPAVIANSNAYKLAEEQRVVTYKPQIDAANARSAQLSAQLTPLYTKFQADQRAANPDRASLQQQATQIRQIEQSGQRELQQILAPVGLSRAYVQEQIQDQLSAATEAAAKKKNISLILDLTGGSVLYADAAYNISQDVLDELNRLIPNANLVPPAGWLPREQREAQAAAAAQAQPAAAPAPATQQPSGR